MSLEVDAAWVWSSLLLWLRLAALFFMTPLFAGFKGPGSVLVLLSLALAGLLAAAWPQPPSSVSTSALFVGGLSEVFIGMVMAFGVHTAISAFGGAGMLIDLQIGFGAGASFDPTTQRNSPVLAAAFGTLAVVGFFAMDAHHALLRGLAFSVNQIPPGTVPTGLSADAVVRQFGAAFTLAVSLIAPAFFSLLLLEAGLTVISRVLPQMNVFFVGMPVKIMLGLAMLAVGAPLLPAVMGRIYASIFEYWAEVLH